MAFHTEVRVPWADLDAAEIVWFGNYFRYVDRAELDMFLALGFTYEAISKGLSVLLPRTKLTCGFRSPARLGDILDVSLSVLATSDRRIHMRFAVMHVAEGRLVVSGEYSVACVDRDTFAARDFPPDLRAAFEARVEPDAAAAR